MKAAIAAMAATMRNATRGPEFDFLGRAFVWLRRVMGRGGPPGEVPREGAEFEEEIASRSFSISEALEYLPLATGWVARRMIASKRGSQRAMSEAGLASVAGSFPVKSS